jgi:UDP-galactopyranose mutase
MGVGVPSLPRLLSVALQSWTDRNRKVLVLSGAWIVGGGLAGITSALEFHRHGVSSHVFEARNDWGGLLRSTEYGGEGDPVVHEPHGSHIFHSDDREVWRLFKEHTPFNRYRHSVLTMVRGELLTWPIQWEEIQRVYPRHVAKELWARTELSKPGEYVTKNGKGEKVPYIDPDTMNFEEWCLRIMPREVYEDFVEPYTEKQWGIPADRLAASFAPKRVQVRTDGDKSLFRDRYQGFPDATRSGSWEAMLRSMLESSRARMHTRWRMTLRSTIEQLALHPPVWRPDFVVITAPLDDFCGRELGRLEWRGLTFSHKYLEPEGGFAQEAMVVNWPARDFPFIRTHETKHASGQRCRGTVLTTEFTGGPGRYYPVPRADGRNREKNDRYVEHVTEEIEALGPRVIVTGRLATYRYQDTDEVARDALDAVREAVGVTSIATV